MTLGEYFGGLDTEPNVIGDREVLRSPWAQLPRERTILTLRLFRGFT
jgi:hypothetical protein